MAAWQRCMARSETTLASKMSVFGHEQESVEVVVRDLMLRSSKEVNINSWFSTGRGRRRSCRSCCTPGPLRVPKKRGKSASLQEAVTLQQTGKCALK